MATGPAEDHEMASDPGSGSAEDAAVLVVLGGPGTADETWMRSWVGTGTTVVAADSGLAAAVRAGVEPHHLVGDLDSADPADVSAAVEGGTEVHAHPSDKDATDGELALDLAVEVLEEVAHNGAGPLHLVVVGGGGGRLDLLAGDLLLLVHPRLASFQVTARFGGSTVTVVRPGPARTLTGRPGEVVSLVAPSGPVRGVTTERLRWALRNGDLGPSSTRGVSNAMEGATATVSVGDGVLWAIQPGELADSVEPRPGTYDPSPRLP